MNPQKRNPTMIFLYTGSYSATLTITDTQGNTSSDIVWITVLQYVYPDMTMINDIPDVPTYTSLIYVENDCCLLMLFSVGSVPFSACFLKF